MLKQYLVKWEIDIDAKDEVDAARQALAVQRDPNSSATIFDVFRITDKTRIDLEDYEEE